MDKQHLSPERAISHAYTLAGVHRLGRHKLPLGAVMNKGLTVRGAQQHGHRYIPMILIGFQPARSASGTLPLNAQAGERPAAVMRC